jgi:hypothetical protein
MSPHLYRGVSPTGTNVRHLYQVGGRWRRRDHVRGHLYQLVPPAGTNVVICTEAKKTSTNKKTDLRYMCDSLVVEQQTSPLVIDRDVKFHAHKQIQVCVLHGLNL